MSEEKKPGRTCAHLPGAARDVACPLCKDLAKFGVPKTGSAIKILNQQPAKPVLRTCPTCGQEVKGLVTREGTLMCQPCAEALDENE